MMDRNCPRPEDLASILSLPDDDPRRRHLAQCPRCRSLLRRYEDFMAPGFTPAEADLRAAAEELRRRLDDVGPEYRENPSCDSDGGCRHADRKGWWRRRSGSLLAAAAIVVACVGIVSIRERLVAPETPSTSPVVLRGDVEALPSFRIRPGDDGARLAWQRPVAADAVVVVLLDSALHEIARIPVTESDAWTLPASHRLAATARYARVVFMQADDTLSSTRTLTLP